MTTLALAEELRLFLPARRRVDGRVRTNPDGTSTLGHLIESAGVPLPEIGRLLVDGHSASTAYRPRGGELVEVHPVARPQTLPNGSAHFLLDVHLGALARRIRLVGLDSAYHNDCDDPDLVTQANVEHRVLLTRDRGLLQRRRLWMGAFVRGQDPHTQLADLLDRFALPPLAPWTRCTACNGTLRPVPKKDVEAELPAGTRRTYDTFARCHDCGRVYWHGAHARHLDAVVDAALAQQRHARPRRP